jgi:hypothetical protein
MIDTLALLLRAYLAAASCSTEAEKVWRLLPSRDSRAWASEAEASIFSSLRRHIISADQVSGKLLGDQGRRQWAQVALGSSQ